MRILFLSSKTLKLPEKSYKIDTIKLNREFDDFSYTGILSLEGLKCRYIIKKLFETSSTFITENGLSVNL